MKSLQFFLREFFKRVLKLSLRQRHLVLEVDLLFSLFAFVFAAIVQTRYSGLTAGLSDLWMAGIVYMLMCGLLFLLFKSYRGLSRYSHFMEMWRLYASVSGAALILYITLSHMAIMSYPFFFTLIVLLTNVFLLFFIRFVVVLIFNYSMAYVSNSYKNAFIFGTEPHSIALAQWLNKSGNRKYQVRGFLSPNPNAHKTRIADLPVFYNGAEFPDWIFRKYEISVIIFPDYDTVKREKQFIETLIRAGMNLLVRPPFEGLSENGDAPMRIKPIQLEDLLGRDEIKINMEQIAAQTNGKTILVTGGAGSIGSELIRQLARFNPGHVVIFDSAETPLHNLRLELERKFPDLNFTAVIGDMRQRPRLEYVFRDFKPQIIFHAAAYKHVPLMEENPCEAIMTNVYGTKMLSKLAVENEVESFVMISTDKAVNPTNVMGASKRIAEIYIQSLARNAQREGMITRFVTTRFGNVLGSNGSVIPHFRQQIENGGPVTVTHPEIIRYFMTIPEACRLVMEAASFGRSGEIYVFDMGQPVKIADLARRMIEMAGLVPDKDIKIEYKGLRPGEKLYEELLNDKEKTLPTSHEKITVAQVREYDFEDIREQILYMVEQAEDVNVLSTVRAMKALVPEFISKNSPYEELDKKKVTA
ncbi:MAG: polysaccharide biosynthesis protein [Paludibacteraceae bacterium]|nr:polysaccharide biosynthesis protein [Paludibacteraceae bacterium]